MPSIDTFLPGALPGSAVLQGALIRSFTLNCEGPSDRGVREWIESTTIARTWPDSPLAPNGNSFALELCNVLSTKPLSSKGPDARSAYGVRLSYFASSTAEASSQNLSILFYVDTKLQSTNAGHPVMSAWGEYTHWFDLPESQTFSIVLDNMGIAPIFLDMIRIELYEGVNSNAFYTRGYDKVCWLCAHNAFANVADGWIGWASQSGTVSSQLNAGVRAFMLDLSLSSDGNDIVLYHAGAPNSWTPRYLRDTIAEINDFLDEYPTEIVTIFFQSNADVKDPRKSPLIKAAFDHVGRSGTSLGQKLFHFHKPNPRANNYDVAGQGAPTIELMVDYNLRCVVFSDWRGPDQFSTSATARDGFAAIWHFVRESAYGSAGLDPNSWSSERAESVDARINDPARTLNLLNHFPDWAVGMIPVLQPPTTSFSTINQCELIDRHVNAWTAKYGLPNFIAVDYVEVGDDGGPLLALRHCNERWAAGEPPSTGQWLPYGKGTQEVDAALRGGGGSSPVRLTLTNMSNFDLKVLASHQTHGKVMADFPTVIPGASADAVRRGNCLGSVACAGVSSDRLAMLGPACFWLMELEGYDRLLFVAVSSPRALALFNNYANARWIERDARINSFISFGSGGDELWGLLYREENDQVATYEDARIRVRPWICGTSAMINDTIGEMTVKVWSY